MPVQEHPFDTLVQRDDSEIRLAEAALLFALDHYPGLQVGRWLACLDRLARRVEQCGARDANEQVCALRTVLVEEERFRGNGANYYDARNSFLHEVIERRLGIPISLSVIWLDVAERLGWECSGVGLPGHYIIRCCKAATNVLVDPFNEGRVLQRADCDRLVSTACGGSTSLCEDNFAPLPKKATLTRMLNNLRPIYAHAQAWHSLNHVLHRLLALHPDSRELQNQILTVSARAARLN